ncbi:MAG: T9SS C-terminal target domain-containing protein [Calditrichaeota bacterium]|nr:MAG: T9SS C-terminal target domain-containing protein [Calditrichota bacterium]MBL1204294.1 T9SS C-terminal target domain-containing protein [Calditrichota bacterium]NOG44124.1 T9SS type A sorting domain-containing protein [Calditrichota bacterium]
MLRKIILFSILFIQLVLGQTREADSLALVTIYNQMDGANWVNADSWLTSADISTWEGVTVSDDRVVNLSLYNKNLSGEIPAAVGDLTGLTSLQFGNDPITGAIPAEISNLTNLLYMYIYYAEITSIPNEIGRMSSLRTVYLNNNDLESIPDSIGSLTELNNLQLQYNNITSLPSTISNLTGLTTLNVEGNKLSVIPAEIYNLTNLLSLSIGSSSLTSVSSDLGNLINLTFLSLSNSQNLSGLPPEVSSLTNLTSLYINGMNLTSIPTGVYSLTNLQTLNISSNSISEIGSSISDLTKLNSLFANHNDLTEIPESIFTLTTLSNLYLYNNFITSIPSEIGDLINLRYLYLQTNQITGNIPSEIGDLTELYYLNLSNNQFEGEIPQRITRLKNVRRLNLENNMLTGTLPDSMSNLEELDYFYAYNNQLSGTIPEDLGNHNSLIYLIIYNNEFDSLPDYSGTNLTNTISQINVYNNKLGFEDIIPNLDVPSSSIYYNPMKPYGTAVDSIVSLGQEITLSVQHKHNDNMYQWYKNGVMLDGETGHNLHFSSIDAEDAGSYTYTVTNTAVADLTLTSEEQNILIPDVEAPSTPGNFYAYPRNTMAYLEWSANNEVDFSVYRIYGGLSSQTSTLIDSTTDNYYTVENLTNNLEYKYYITASDLWGNESASTAEKNVTPDGTPPAVPTGLMAFAGEASVDLQWDENSEDDIDYYSIYFGTSPNPTQRYTNTSSNSITVSNLTNDVMYYFRISAIDHALNISDTTADVTSTPSDMKPPAPIDVNVVENNQKLIAQWNIEKTIPDFYAYKLYMDTVPNPVKLVDSLLTQYYVNSNDLSIDIEGLENNKTYYLRLKTFDTGGKESDFSNEVMAEPDNYRSLDSLALVEFYNAMDGSNWTGADSWLTSSEISSWEGVTVTNDRVSQLNLYNKSLSGNIPSVIGSLTELTYLRFGYDDITGEIPSEVGLLDKLQTLEVRNTEITKVPDEIGQLSNLVTLALHSNNITELPDVFANLDKLSNLYLYSNELTTVPQSIGSLEKITYLRLDNNNISSLPVELFNLETLTQLFINTNQLTSIPTEISNLTNLTYLNISYNNISTFPQELSSLSNLTQLYLDGMALTQIPSFVFDLSNLRTFSLSYNEFNSVPSELFNLTELTYINLSDNNFTGAIPDGFGDLTNLNSLYLYRNEFSGEIPSAIGNITNLVNLNLYGNQLSGQIPASLGNLSKLSNLSLYNNQLEGEIPDEINSLPNLRYLYIQNNQLSGTISSEISNLENLYYLNLSNNEFSGTLPASFGDFKNIRQVQVQNNNLDSLPDFTGTSMDSILNLFYISNNYLGFEDVVPNVGVPSGNYSYSPMKAYGEQIDTVSQAGNSLQLSVIHKHADNEYQWYKDSQILDGETNQTLSIDTLKVEDIGAYTYQITNLNAPSLTLVSANINVFIPDSVSPATPNNFAVYPRNSAVLLSWNNVPELDLSVYRIYGGVVGSPTSLIDSTTALKYMINGLSNGTEYQYYITAVDRWGNESLPSATMQVTPDGTAPSVPANIVAMPLENSVFLNWDKNPESDLLRYHIYSGQSAGNLSLTDSSVVDSAIVDGLINGREYFFAVSAVDRAINKSDTSAVVSAIPVNLVPPVVAGLAVIENDTKLTLKWTQSQIPDFNYYKIYMGTSANPTTAVDSIYQSYVGLKEYTGLVNGTEYFFRMTQVDDNLIESDFSIEVNGTPGEYFEQDSLAVVAVYDSLGGADWTDNSNWKTSASLDDWYGITVDDGRVTRVQLYNNNLIGTIPAEVGGLTAISNFELGNNAGITGTIPDTIGSMTNLEYLYLYNTGLSGTIPKEIGNLSALRYLYLYSNSLTGAIPAELKSLSNLNRLYLYQNELSGSIPAELGELENLQYLNLQSNQLTGNIPEEFGQLSNLYNMNVQSNELSGEIPESIGNLTNLQYIYFSSNQLSGTIPAKLGQMANLYGLYIADNEFTGQLPPEIGGLPNLSQFYAYGNNFTGYVPVEYRDMQNIDRFYIYNNEIDSLPDFSGSSFDQSVRYFSVYGNKLEFNDIIPNIAVAENSFSYSPQDSLGSYITDFVNEGGEYTMTVSTPGDSNNYQWYKDNSAVTGATESSYTISNFTEDNNGVYNVRVSNSMAPSLTLISRTTTLQLVAKPKISTSLLQNPASTKYTDIVVVSDMELLTTSKVDVLGPGGTTTLSLSQISGSTVYKTSHIFNSEGQHTLTITANGASGLDSVQVRVLNFVLAKVGEDNLIATVDQKAKISFSVPDLDKNRFVRAETVKMNKKGHFIFGPEISIDEKSELSIQFEAEQFEDISKLFVYQKSGQEWIRLKSAVYKTAKLIKAKVPVLGEFKIETDMEFTGSNIMPEKYALHQNYPNPFNPVTTIPFSLKDDTKVALYIYNILGQRVRTLVNKKYEAGTYQLKWDGRNDYGVKVSTGLYFYNIVTPKFVKSKKMILLK